MNVERTIDFILQHQAASEVRLAKAEERMAKHDERMAKHDERMTRLEAKTDKRFNAIGKLIEMGMTQLAAGEKARREMQKHLEKHLEALGEKIDILVDSQIATQHRIARLENGAPPPKKRRR